MSGAPPASPPPGAGVGGSGAGPGVGGAGSGSRRLCRSPRSFCAAGGGRPSPLGPSSRRFPGSSGGRERGSRGGSSGGREGAGRPPAGRARAAMKKPDGKVVLLGDMNVGKTSLLHRYMEKRFQETVSTVGGAFYLKQWGPYNISIWDTAGETPGEGPGGAGGGPAPTAPGASRPPRPLPGVCRRGCPSPPGPAAAELAPPPPPAGNARRRRPWLGHSACVLLFPLILARPYCKGSCRWGRTAVGWPRSGQLRLSEDPRAQEMGRTPLCPGPGGRHRDREILPGRLALRALFGLCCEATRFKQIVWQ